MVKINFNVEISNRVLYTFISVVMLIALAVGIYAYGSTQPSVMGHTLGEIAPPASCTTGQYLEWTSSGWRCASVSSSGSSYWNSGGGLIYPSGGESYPSYLTYLGRVGIGISSSPQSRLAVGGEGSSSYAIYGKGTYGVYGEGSIFGIYGKSGTSSGVYGSGMVGVSGEGLSTGISGKATSSTGYAGYFTGGKGVYTDSYLILKPITPSSSFCTTQNEGALVYNKNNDLLYFCRCTSSGCAWKSIKYE